MAEPEDKARDRTLSASSEQSEPEPEPQFEPIIRLPEVNISTNEENEAVLLKLRAKLYRFDATNDDGPEWKERGTGEVKLLRHKENNSVRIVMRRDKTLKVCANHFITPWMELKPSMGSEKAFVYSVAADFADEAPKTECLAIKFGSVEFANHFKEKFNEARKIVATQCRLYNSDDESKDISSDSGEEDPEENLSKEPVEVTEKLSNLSLSKEKADEVIDK